MYTYVYIYIYNMCTTCIYIYIYIYTYVFFFNYTYIYIYIYIYIWAGPGIPLTRSLHCLSGPPKRGVSKPTIYYVPPFPLNKHTRSCLGQWSSTYLGQLMDNSGIYKL